MPKKEKPIQTQHCRKHSIIQPFYAQKLLVFCFKIDDRLNAVGHPRSAESRFRMGAVSQPQIKFRTAFVLAGT